MSRYWAVLDTEDVQEIDEATEVAAFDSPPSEKDLREYEGMVLVEYRRGEAVNVRLLER